MEIAFLCERLKCLPNPGGLFQQDPTHLKLIERVLQASDAYQRKKIEAKQNASERTPTNSEGTEPG